jgi:hypothetical protein
VSSVDQIDMFPIDRIFVASKLIPGLQRVL